MEELEVREGHILLHVRQGETVNTFELFFGHGEGTFGLFCYEAFEAEYLLALHRVAEGCLLYVIDEEELLDQARARDEQLEKEWEAEEELDARRAKLEELKKTTYVTNGVQHSTPTPPTEALEDAE